MPAETSTLVGTTSAGTFSSIVVKETSDPTNPKYAPAKSIVGADGVVMTPAKDSTLAEANAKLAALHADNGAAGDEAPTLAAHATGVIGWLRKIVDVLAAPLTFSAGYAASGKTPVAGYFAADAHSASFTPIAGRAFNVSVWGSFAGRVALTRSFDGGTTFLPITAAGADLYSWSAPASEQMQEDEVGVLYRLECDWAAGVVNYRISQ